MLFRVYDDRTNETLYTDEFTGQCEQYIEVNYDECSEDWYHIWIEQVKD